jgi:hypothetical protein
MRERLRTIASQELEQRQRPVPFLSNGTVSELIIGDTHQDR